MYGFGSTSTPRDPCVYSRYVMLPTRGWYAPTSRYDGLSTCSFWKIPRMTTSSPCSA